LRDSERGQEQEQREHARSPTDDGWEMHRRDGSGYLGTVVAQDTRFPSRPFRSPMRNIASYFLRGLVLTVPLAVTVAVCWVALTTIDGWLGIPVPGVGLLV